MKVYLKKGKSSYKEKDMVSKLQSVFEKKVAEDPNFSFEPASDFDGLTKLYHKHVPQDVDFEEVAGQNNDFDTHEEFKNAIKETVEPTKTFIDPLLKQEVLTRDYVLKDEFGQANPNNEAQSNFNEPTDFKTAFEIPNADGEDQIKQNTNQQDGQPSSGGGGSKTGKKDPQEPVNPYHDEMSKGKQKRSNQKFAKYIVEAVCMLAEKGFVWWTTKDINEAKLIEYELNKEMNLSLLLDMEDGQQVTVKTFFASQCVKSEQLATYTEEEKKDLADALAVVMQEKGIAPTPAQELALIAFSMFGNKILMALALNSQNKSVLNQLRMMNEQTGGMYREQPTNVVPEPPRQAEPEPVDFKEATTPQPVEPSPVMQEELPIVEQTIQTKE